MGLFTRSDARVRTKRAWLLLASAVATVGGVAPTVALSMYALIDRHYVALLAVVPCFGAQFGLMHLWNRKWLERRGRLRADEHGLWLDDALIVARGALRHGHVVRRDGVAYVRLGRTLQPIEIGVEDEEEGAALLSAMRLDAPRSVGQFTMSHGTHRRAWIKAAVILSLCLPWSFGVLHFAQNVGVFLAWLFVQAIAACVWTQNQFVRVSVGADGIHLRRPLSGSRFIPFGALHAAEIDGRNVALRVRDGSVVEMHHSSSGKGWKPLLYRDGADEGQMLVDRINGQAEQHRRAGGGVQLLARGARATREWVREVALSSDEHASFRAAAIPADQLWRIVEDPAAATTARAGAAVALRSRLDESGRSPLRVVADACAAPKLRVALQLAASEATPETLEHAFDALEDDGARRHASLSR